ncbi:MAG: TIGR00282 family metallophosphoesterase [Patescibacteria group bacterium]
MHILIIGDIVGKPGRRAVTEILPQLKIDHSIDLVIANGENVSHGRGLSFNHYEALREVGIDWFTSGNHIWARADILPYLDDPKIQIIRPANYPGAVPGRGIASFKVGTTPIHLLNLMGRVFMAEETDNPFRLFDELIEKLKGVIIVDFHAEATSEKWAFGHHVTDRATAVVGTHTHVPTADERLLGAGTAFISDIGMTGPIDSNIGAEKGTIINHFLTGLPWRYEVAENGPIWFNAVLVTIDVKTHRATHIERIQKVLDS